jgi:hypothetical protein
MPTPYHPRRWFGWSDLTLRPLIDGLEKAGIPIGDGASLDI